MSAFNVDEGVIPSAAADERGVRDSTAVATQAETDEQRAKVLAAGDTPDAPPTLSRHAVEAPSQMPFVHSRLDFAPFAASAHEGVDDRESFMSDFTGRNACLPAPKLSSPNSLHSAWPACTRALVTTPEGDPKKLFAWVGVLK